MFILTHRSLSNSARALASFLEDRTGRRIRVDYGDNRLMETPLIRWGNSSFPQAMETPYNDPTKLRVAGNKKTFSDEMERTMIPAILFRRGIPDKFPVVVRQTLTGKGGEGIVVCTEMEEFMPYRQYFWSTWFDFSYELGVHVVDGKIVKVFKKVPRDGMEEPTFPIRNLSKGYHFRRVNTESFAKLPQAIADFYKVFPIGFGRLDIGWDREAKCYRIIEFNSAPGIASNPDTLEQYGNALHQSIFLHRRS